MRSSRGRATLAAVAAALVLMARARRVEAQQAQGFALDRLYRSAPGGGWVVMDTLDMHGGFGGAMSLTVGYAHDPLVVRSSDGSQRLAVVSDQASAGFGFAFSYDRVRAYLAMDAAVGAGGNSGSVGGNQFTAPSIDLSSTPDMLADARLGVDARLLGGPASPFRLGIGAQLMIPAGNVAAYVTDDTYRFIVRALVAGDLGHFAYAGQLGVHARPRDDSPTPEGPAGPELLFGAAGGARLLLGAHGAAAFVVGPELFGATAFGSFFGPTTTALEALLSARIEGTGTGPQLRVKIGAGPGLVQHFGAPEWRLVLGVEVFDHGPVR